MYYISDIDDLVAFARIVEAGQTDANAKVVAKSINYRDYSGYWAYSNVGLIGKTHRIQVHLTETVQRLRQTVYCLPKQMVPLLKMLI